MRKNASMAKVTAAAFNLSEKAFKNWRKWVECYERTRDFHDQMASNRAYDHFSDLQTISDHLLRHAGLSEEEIDAKKRAVRYGHKVPA